MGMYKAFMVYLEIELSKFCWGFWIICSCMNVYLEPQNASTSKDDVCGDSGE
jgi:hypothetical protein